MIPNQCKGGDHVRRAWYFSPHRDSPHPYFLMKDDVERELVLLRTKLEIRSWALRFSLAMNAGFFVYLVTR